MVNLWSKRGLHTRIGPIETEHHVLSLSTVYIQLKIALYHIYKLRRDIQPCVDLQKNKHFVYRPNMHTNSTVVTIGVH